MTTKGVRVTRERIDLKGGKETLLMTLYLRALDSRAAAPILGDEYADELRSRIDYNFDRLAPMRGNASTIAIRAKQLDTWTRQLLAEHLACGLDSRVFRIDPPHSARWLDLDYPEVIRLRERLYPARDGATMIGASVTDESWWSQIPSDRPTLMLAEGLLMYLAAPDVHRLLDRAIAHLPSGRVAFDVVNRWVVTASKYQPAFRRAGAVFGWELGDPHELERRHPRLRLAADRPIVALLRGADLPARYRAVLAAMTLLPALRNSMRLLQYTF